MANAAHPFLLMFSFPSPTFAFPTKTSNNLSSPLSPVFILEPQVLIEGVLFRARYLGSTQLVCEGQPTKSTRMMQAEEAVSRIKVNLNLSILFSVTYQSKFHLLMLSKGLGKPE
jgi:hypothetical protein